MEWTNLTVFDVATRLVVTKARVILDNGTIRFEGDEDIIASIVDGVRNFDGTTLTPMDGRIFLELLPLRLTTPYLTAQPIERGDNPLPPL